jgi:predicted TPR repeat methyltransferase
MNVKQSYDGWANQYDTNNNKTRDLEALSIRTALENISFDRCLEIGCGTGKNTEWLITRAKHVTAVDLSEEMLAKAMEKIKSGKVQFHQADINDNWTFVHHPYDLLIFSLVLEHIENLTDIFQKASKSTVQGGYVYIGELHPFKQYSGTKAKYETEDGTQTVTCFTHHISDFTQAAKQSGFELIDLQEYFDEDDKTIPPRILMILLRKITNTV